MGSGPVGVRSDTVFSAIAVVVVAWVTLATCSRSAGLVPMCPALGALGSRPAGRDGPPAGGLVFTPPNSIRGQGRRRCCRQYVSAAIAVSARPPRAAVFYFSQVLASTSPGGDACRVRRSGPPDGCLAVHGGEPSAPCTGRGLWSMVERSCFCSRLRGGRLGACASGRGCPRCACGRGGRWVPCYP